MIRITRETDYGIVLMTQMARAQNVSFSASSLAEALSLPSPMVGKILKALTRAGLLTSTRGPQGGYRLAARPVDITVTEIIGALEGPIALTDCVPGGAGHCEHQSGCTVSGHWGLINQAVKSALDGISLADMSRPADVPMSLMHIGLRESL